MVRTEELIPMSVLSDTECKFKREVAFSEIEINELVGVTVEDSYENNQKVYTTTASFTTHRHEPLKSRRLAFRLTAADGKRYMIGTISRPYPVVKESVPYPGKLPDTTLNSVTITWKSILPMLLILE